MKQFATALRFSLKEQMTNKFAFGLLVVFVPLWYFILGIITPGDMVGFKFALNGDILQANGHNITLVTAGLNVLSMILGFMFYHSAHRSLDFDKRLTRAGLNRVSYMFAKTVVLLIVTALVALYTLVILLAFWHSPNNLFEIWLGFWMISLIYASFGLALGLLISNELVGFFMVIMLSLLDTFLQNPIGNPAANKDFLAYFPSYSAMQLSVAGGATHLFADT